MDAAERLVNLALLLASSRTHVTAEECRTAGLGYPDGQDIAAFLRMFERDKDTLRAAGLVIDVALDDTNTEAYRLDAAATFARPVDLSAEEVSVLRAVAAALAGDQSFPFHEDLALALGKLGAVGHDAPMGAGALGGIEESEHAQQVAALAEAVRMHKGVTFDYTNSAGVARRRSVDPYGLFYREGQWYVTGRDTDVDDIRTFNVERLGNLDVNPLKPRTPDFERPADFDISEQERLPFQYGPRPVEARIRFEPEVAWRAEGLARGHGSIAALSDGSAVWTVQAADLGRLASWIVDAGAGLHAVDPPELLEVVHAGLKRVVAAHG